MTVRRATPADVPALLAMLQRLHRVAGYAFAFDPVHVETTLLADAIAGAGLCLVLEADGELAGLLLAQIGGHPWNGTPVAVELAWWVEPRARRGRAALHLVTAYVGWARRRGCRTIAATTLEHLGMRRQSRRIGKLYERLGLTRREASWAMELG